MGQALASSLQHGAFSADPSKPFQGHVRPPDPLKPLVFDPDVGKYNKSGRNDADLLSETLKCPPKPPPNEDREQILRNYLLNKYAAFTAKPLLLQNLRIQPNSAKFVTVAKEVKSLPDASRACDAEERCRYFAFDPARENATLMQGAQFEVLREDGVISGEHFRRVLDAQVDTHTLVFANARARCAKVVRTAPNVFETEEAARLCRNTPRCSHFVMTTIGSPWNNTADESASPDPTRIWLKLCGGSQIDLVPEPGTVSGIRTAKFGAGNIKERGARWRLVKMDELNLPNEESASADAGGTGGDTAANAKSICENPAVNGDVDGDTLDQLGAEPVPALPVRKITGPGSPPVNGPISIPKMYKHLLYLSGSNSEWWNAGSSSSTTSIGSLLAPNGTVGDGGERRLSACDTWPNACRDWVDFLYPKELKARFPPNQGTNPPELTYELVPGTFKLRKDNPNLTLHRYMEELPTEMDVDLTTGQENLVPVKEYPNYPRPDWAKKDNPVWRFMMWKEQVLAQKKPDGKVKTNIDLT